MKRWLVNIGIALAFLLGAVGAGHATPLPQNLLRYTPPNYDVYRVSHGTYINEYFYPTLFLWPNGRLNLVGVPFEFSSPPQATGQQTLRSIRTLSANFWGFVTAFPQVNDLMSFSGFNDARITVFTGQADSAATFKRGGAIVTGVAADSLCEGRAWIIIGNPLSPDDSITTYWRVVNK